MSQKPEEDIQNLTAEDIRGAWLSSAISQRQFDLVTASRKLNADEIKRKLSALATVAKWKRRKNRKYEHLSGAERVEKHADKKAAIDEQISAARAAINWERRNEAETSLLKWIENYLMEPKPAANLFRYKTSPRLAEAVKMLEAGIGDSSFPFHIRIARGFGKTTLAEAAIAYAAATGRRHFIVIVSAKADDAVQIVEDVFDIFAGAPTFAQDYPDIALPIQLLNGSWRRKQTFKGRRTAFAKTHSRVVLPSLLLDDGTPSPASGTIIAARGFDGRVRGMKAGSKRPDLLVLDDLQTDQDAANEEIVAKSVAKVRHSFLNLGGREKLAVIMTSTPIQPDDLSETFANDPAWKTVTFKAFDQWPTEWEKRRDEGLWGEYKRIYQRELFIGNADPHGAATKFYQANRQQMDAGAVVLDENRFDARIQVSAVQALMDLLFDNGAEAFEAEQQMHPRRRQFAFELTPQTVLSRIRRGVATGTPVANNVLTVAATDINPSYALSTTVVSFDVLRTGLVSFYQVSPVRISDAENDTAYHSAVYEAVAAHVREVAETCGRLNLKLDAYGIDAGGKQFDPVTRFAAESEKLVGQKVTAMTGRAGQSWNPFPRSRLRAPMNETVLCKSERGAVWLAWNADVHKESCQKAWGSEIGACGGLSLFDGNLDHTDFAIQVSNERLVEKRKRPDGRIAYRWKSREPHDLLDCLAMCYALAGANGIGASGFIENTTRRKLAVCL